MKKTKKFSVYLVGGGSGGHILPLKALAEQLAIKYSKENVLITFACEKGSAFDEVMRIPEVSRVHKINAGKFRRYHGDSFFSHLIDVKTLLKNALDFFRFVSGCLEAIIDLMCHRPHVVFLKGGFVCVPYGWAARILRIPYVTHDSDAIPGLANKIVSKGAVKNLVAIVGEYPYSKDKTIVTGIPINSAYFDSNESRKEEAREKLEIPKEDIVVLITGGGLGAQKMNESVIKSIEYVSTAKESAVSRSGQMYIVHLTGKGPYKEALDLYEETSLSPDRINVIDFTTDMLSYTLAADIVISRAGATAIAEFSAAKKACILIPGVHLTGGQQVHNANILEKQGAAKVLLDQDVEGISQALIELATNPDLREELGEKIHTFATQDSAMRIIEILSSIASYKPNSDGDK